MNAISRAPESTATRTTRSCASPNGASRRARRHRLLGPRSRHGAQGMEGRLLHRSRAQAQRRRQRRPEARRHPRQARDGGASVLVVGRPISRAEDPARARRRRSRRRWHGARRGCRLALALALAALAAPSLVADAALPPTRPLGRRTHGPASLFLQCSRHAPEFVPTAYRATAADVVALEGLIPAAPSRRRPATATIRRVARDVSTRRACRAHSYAAWTPTAGP